MHREPADPETAIGSSDGPMQKKCQHSKVQVRIFEPPEVPLKSIDERNDFDRHDTPKHDEPKPGTPHDSEEERTVDGEETILHGAKQIKSTGSQDVTFLVDDASVPIKIQKIAGNC
jgi:hypothetical protein